MKTLYQIKEGQRSVTATMESAGQIPHIGLPEADSAERFHFWLIITVLSLFIFFLYYSERIQQVM